jgi:hypothetical protein
VIEALMTFLAGVAIPLLPVAGFAAADRLHKHRMIHHSHRSDR